MKKLKCPNSIPFADTTSNKLSRISYLNFKDDGEIANFISGIVWRIDNRSSIWKSIHDTRKNNYLQSAWELL